MRQGAPTAAVGYPLNVAAPAPGTTTRAVRQAAPSAARRVLVCIAYSNSWVSARSDTTVKILLNEALLSDSPAPIFEPYVCKIIDVKRLRDLVIPVRRSPWLVVAALAGRPPPGVGHQFPAVLAWPDPREDAALSGLDDPTNRCAARNLMFVSHPFGIPAAPS